MRDVMKSGWRSCSARLKKILKIGLTRLYIDAYHLLDVLSDLRVAEGVRKKSAKY